ncbi:hypothetical protein BZA05DRAFT_113646 [Tricharina praecox]|uniref:uncharacterized protein n=1 Tax=Tricharina praecox TaxID=43433 RepID=UPI00221E7595|nr:uncharacterized protein BZA05DRAFT_113646 [Tricharina praecox]KAI5858048.1 hypothetical protein BZA05DRAFT_113646 [Tricharina praecox]
MRSNRSLGMGMEGNANASSIQSSIQTAIMGCRKTVLPTTARKEQNRTVCEPAQPVHSIERAGPPTSFRSPRPSHLPCALHVQYVSKKCHVCRVCRRMYSAVPIQISQKSETRKEVHRYFLLTQLESRKQISRVASDPPLSSPRARPSIMYYTKAKPPLPSNSTELAVTCCYRRPCTDCYCYLLLLLMRGFWANRYLPGQCASRYIAVGI